MATNLLDFNIFVMNIHILKFLEETDHKFYDIQTDLVPFFAENQYNNKLNKIFEEKRVSKDDLSNLIFSENMSNIIQSKNRFCSVIGFENASDYLMQVDSLKLYKKINMEAITKNTKNVNQAFSYAKKIVRKQ